MAPRMRRPRGSGTIRTLPSRRVQAIHTGPDGIKRGRTFDDKLTAQTWLAEQARTVAAGSWEPPTETSTRALTLADYGASWLAAREVKPRTRAQYRALLDDVILPPLGGLRLERSSRRPCGPGSPASTRSRRHGGRRRTACCGPSSALR